MKRKLHLMKKLGWLFLCLFIFNNGVLQAQSEVTVEPGFNTLSDAVAANPGATLILKRGGDYLVDAQVEINVATIIKGEASPAETRPAIVTYLANPGEALGKNIFAVAANCTLQDIGIMGFAPDNQQIGGNNTGAANVIVTADGITLVLDGCIFQGSHTAASTGAHNDLVVTMKNNVFFNLTNLGWDNWGGFGFGFEGDNIDYKAYNNTYVTAGRIFNAGVTGPNGSELMEHNSYVLTWGDTFYPSFNKNYTVKNNIFYDSQVRGYVGVREIPGFEDWPGDFSDWTAPNIPVEDTLCGDVAVFAHVADSTKSREVVVTNNLKMYSQHVLDFYAENNVTPMTFFNVTGYKFAERYDWVVEDNILQEDGNTVDPQFAMGAIPDEAYTNMFLNRQQRSLPVELQDANFPYENAWRPDGAEQGHFIWPLPFNLKPMNTEIYSAGDDGYPLGDLNWFGEEVVAAWEAGESNPLGIHDKFAAEFGLKNYPNPFSNSTMISYDLISMEMVTLKVFNTVGAEVATLVNEIQIPGKHEVSFDGANLSNGIYFYSIQVGGFSEVQKMMLVK